MAIYVEKCDGYIVDNPNIDFQRCDGEVFSYDEVSTAGVTNTSNSLTIQGGQGSFPLAIIDTDKAQEMTFASAKFTLDMFEMANAVKHTEGDFGMLETGRYDVVTGLKVTIPFECHNVYVRGLEIADTAAAGKFTVTVTEATESTAGSTLLTFYTGDVVVGDTVRVSYQRRLVAGTDVSVKTNSTTAKGALFVHWPIMSAGDDCAEAARKGWLHLIVPRVRVTALPGIDSSYKTAGTYSLTFAAVDPKRADGKMCRWVYEPLDENGDYVTKSGGTVEYEKLIGGEVGE